MGAGSSRQSGGEPEHFFSVNKANPSKRPPSSRPHKTQILPPRLASPRRSSNLDGSMDYGLVWLGLSDGRVCQVSLATMSVVFSLQISSSGVRSLCVSSSPSGSDVVYLGDNKGQMYEVSKGGAKPITPPHKDAVVSIAKAARDGGVLISASRDGSVRVWDNASTGGVVGKYVIGPMKVWVSGVQVEDNIVVSDGADNMIIKHEFGTGE